MSIMLNPYCTLPSWGHFLRRQGLKYLCWGLSEPVLCRQRLSCRSCLYFAPTIYTLISHLSSTPNNSFAFLVLTSKYKLGLSLDTSLFIASLAFLILLPSPPQSRRHDEEAVGGINPVHRQPHVLVELPKAHHCRRRCHQGRDDGDDGDEVCS